MEKSDDSVVNDNVEESSTNESKKEVIEEKLDERIPVQTDDDSVSDIPSKKNRNILIVAVIIGCFAIGSGVVIFFGDDIQFDASKIPVGLLDTQHEGKKLPSSLTDQTLSSQIILEQFTIGEKGLNWNCDRTDQFGTEEQCVNYWDSLLVIQEELGRFSVLEKLNEDGHLSDAVKQVILDVEGIALP